MSINFDINQLSADPIPQPSLAQRSVPRVSLNDTGFFGGARKSIHGETRVFEDHEIARIHQPDSTKAFSSSQIEVFFKDGKAILQQQGTRACSAACVAMLILDKGGIPNWQQVRSTNLGNTEMMKFSLQKAQLKPIQTNLSRDQSPLSTLQSLIEKNGSAIVEIISQSFGGHVVIADQVSPDLKEIRIRDPYHGWMIDVEAKAYLSYWQSRNVLQVK
jgi:hypothetical protein